MINEGADKLRIYISQTKTDQELINLENLIITKPTLSIYTTDD
jgi:hypothetical protein